MDKKSLLGSLLFLRLLTCLAGQDVRVSISSREGYVGLPLQYVITVTDEKEAQVPELVGLDDFDVTYQGQSQSSQTSIVNGKRSSSVKVQFTWNLTPLREGELTIPSQKVWVNGKEWDTPSGTVVISPPRKVEGFLLTLDSDQKRAYRGQTVTVNLDFYVSREVGNLNFTLPGQGKGSREGEDFILGESLPPAGSGQNVRQVSIGGRVFYGYVDSRLEGGKQYTVLTLPLKVIPLKAGILSLEGASVAFSVEEGAWPRTSLVNYVVPSDPFTLEVRKLPEEIAASPNGILLARGELDVRAELSAREARPGDPLTLTVTLSGLVNPENCDIPGLDRFTSLAEDFSLPSSRSRPKVEGDRLTLVQTVRPKAVTSGAIPPLEFVYLDLQSDQVRRAVTESIPLAMTSAGSLSVNDMEVFNDEEGEGDDLRINDKGISQNKRGEELFRDTRGTVFMGSSTYLILLSSPPALFLILLVLKGVGRALRNRKERQARDPYRRFLSEMEETEKLYGPFDRYLRNRFFKGRSFDPDELNRVLPSREICAELIEVYHALERERFSGEASKSLRENILKTLEKVEAAL